MKKEDRFLSVFGFIYMVLAFMSLIVYMITHYTDSLVVFALFTILSHIDTLIKTISVRFDKQFENYIVKPKSVVVNLNGETVLEQKEKENNER